MKKSKTIGLRLNLPTTVIFENGFTITYLYTAVGFKMGRTVTSISPESGTVVILKEKGTMEVEDQFL